MSKRYKWPQDPKGYQRERPTASPKHQALNAAAGPQRHLWRQGPVRSWPARIAALLKEGRLW